MLRIIILAAAVAFSLNAQATTPEYFHDSCQPFQGLQFVPRLDLKGPAQSFSNGVIEYNPELMARLPLHVQDFIMLHESGHIRLRHGIKYKDADPATRKLAEFEADAWAAGIWPLRWSKLELLNDVYQILKGRQGEADHPDGLERIARIRAIVESPNRPASCPSDQPMLRY